MNKKNIVILSLATTLLFANYAVGMDKTNKNRSLGPLELTYTPETKSKTLKFLESYEKRPVKVTCEQDITTKDLNELIRMLSKGKHTIEELRLQNCPEIKFPLIRFKEIKNLKRIIFARLDMQHVDFAKDLAKYNKKKLVLIRIAYCTNVPLLLDLEELFSSKLEFSFARC